eukprot:72291_1
MRRVITRRNKEKASSDVDYQMYSLGKMSIHCINKGETQLEWEFETCDYFAQLNDKCLVKEALETWRANNMFVLDEGGRISINSKHFNPAHLRKGKALIEYYTNKKIDIPHRVDAAIDDSREAFGRA